MQSQTQGPGEDPSIQQSLQHIVQPRFHLVINYINSNYHPARWSSGGVHPETGRLEVRPKTVSMLPIGSLLGPSVSRVGIGGGGLDQPMIPGCSTAAAHQFPQGTVAGTLTTRFWRYLHCCNHFRPLQFKYTACCQRQTFTLRHWQHVGCLLML